jgi:hypothetical protein
MRILLAALLASSLLSVTAITPARADGAPSPTPAEAARARWPTHRGWLVGFGLHAGGLVAECEEGADCDWKAGGLDVHVGYFLGPRLALMLDVWGMYHTEDRLTIYQTITTAAAQLWIDRHFWVKAGFGHARAGYHYDGLLIDARDETENVPGVLLAVGYDLHIVPSWTLDVQLRYGTGTYDTIKGHNTSIAVGFNWY